MTGWLLVIDGGYIAFKGRVGPGLKIAFPHSATAGRTKITIRDLTAKDNFHLVGPGVNKTSGVAFVGKKTIVATLKKGSYKYQCSVHFFKGTFKVV